MILKSRLIGGPKMVSNEAYDELKQNLKKLERILVEFDYGK